MKSVIHNRRIRNRMQGVLLLLPVIALPLATMGVTTPSYLRYRDAQHHEADARQGQAYALAKQTEWRALGPVEERKAELREVNQILNDLIPAWQEELVLHGAVRDAAAAVGMDLSRMQLQEPEPMGDPLLGFVVVERGVTLTAEGYAEGAQQLIDRLRGQGWPTCVHSIDIYQDQANTHRFSFELRLGIFHYAPAEKYIRTELDDGELEGVPQLEEPIQ